jgi:FhuF 2Fe-2S C-terminal domain
VIIALATMTGLGPAAQWRLVGDGLSGALLEQGKALGQVPGAIALAREILSVKGTKLWAKQGDFVEIVLPGPDVTGPARARDWFRLRGGCCRFYTTEGGDYCSTCVLRDRDDQISRLRTYLGETLAAE